MKLILKKPFIKKLSKTKYRVLLGPFNDIKKIEDHLMKLNIKF
jgi:cell division protein FtsN